MLDAFNIDDLPLLLARSLFSFLCNLPFHLVVSTVKMTVICVRITSVILAYYTA